MRAMHKAAKLLAKHGTPGAWALTTRGLTAVLHHQELALRNPEAWLARQRASPAPPPDAFLKSLRKAFRRRLLRAVRHRIPVHGARYTYDMVGLLCGISTQRVVQVRQESGLEISRHADAAALRAQTVSRWQVLVRPRPVARKTRRK